MKIFEFLFSVHPGIWSLIIAVIAVIVIYGMFRCQSNRARGTVLFLGMLVIAPLLWTVVQSLQGTAAQRGAIEMDKRLYGGPHSGEMQVSPEEIQRQASEVLMVLTLYENHTTPSGAVEFDLDPFGKLIPANHPDPSIFSERVALTFAALNRDWKESRDSFVNRWAQAYQLAMDNLGSETGGLRVLPQVDKEPFCAAVAARYLVEWDHPNLVPKYCEYTPAVPVYILPNGHAVRVPYARVKRFDTVTTWGFSSWLERDGYPYVAHLCGMALGWGNEFPLRAKVDSRVAKTLDDTCPEGNKFLAALTGGTELSPLYFRGKAKVFVGTEFKDRLAQVLFGHDYATAFGDAETALRVGWFLATHPANRWSGNAAPPNGGKLAHSHVANLIREAFATWGEIHWPADVQNSPLTWAVSEWEHLAKQVVPLDGPPRALTAADVAAAEKVRAAGFKLK